MLSASKVLIVSVMDWIIPATHGLPPKNYKDHYQFQSIFPQDESDNHW